MATARPVRSMDPYAEQFWAFTREKELRLQQCSECGKFRWPPGPTCDRCLSDAFAWTALSGTAKVLSWTTFRRGYFPEYPPPHTVVALELAGGPLFIAYPVDLEPSALRGVELMQRAGVRIGFGTDLIGPLDRHQASEFVIRREILEPVEILRQATSVNADIINQGSQLG